MAIPGGTPLHYAVHCGNFLAVNLIITNGADVNVTANNDVAALHIAAAQGNKSIVELLLSAGADANIKDGKGRTAIQIAAEGKHKEIVSLLVKSLRFIIFIVLNVYNCYSPMTWL